MGVLPLVEVDRRVEVPAGGPGDHGQAFVGSVRKIGGPCSGRLQQQAPVRLEGPSQEPAATFDPEANHVEDLPALDVAEVDRRAGDTAPGRARDARPFGRVDEFLPARVSAQALRVDGEELCRCASPLLAQAFRLGAEDRRAVLGVRVLWFVRTAARQAEGPLDLAAPRSSDAALILPTEGRCRAAIGLPATQVDVRDRLQASSRRRLEPSHVHALHARELAQERVPCRFLQPSLDGARLEACEPVR